MKVVDSSGWLEFLADGPLADQYAPHLEAAGDLVTPTIVLYEVYRWVKRERTEEEALIAAAQIEKTEIVPLTTSIALTAADIGLEYGLALADSVVYATALSQDAELITSDRDFEALPGVQYLAK